MDVAGEEAKPDLGWLDLGGTATSGSAVEPTVFTLRAAAADCSGVDEGRDGDPLTNREAVVLQHGEAALAGGGGGALFVKVLENGVAVLTAATTGPGETRVPGFNERCLLRVSASTPSRCSARSRRPRAAQSGEEKRARRRPERGTRGAGVDNEDADEEKTRRGRGRREDVANPDGGEIGSSTACA